MWGDGMNTKTIREILFNGWEGCSDHNCIIRKNSGQGTNGGCHCLMNMSRAQAQILKGRLSTIIDKEIKN